MSKFIIFKYKDMTITQEWFEPMDGKWRWGDKDEVIIEKDELFYPIMGKVEKYE